MISGFVRPGELCFDIGAHAGDLTAILLQAGGRVVAVEPQPQFVELLQRRFQGDPNVTVVAAGVADRLGKARLSICRQAPALSTLKPHWKHGRFRDRSWDEEIDVALETLDHLIDHFGVPTFAKIDVEGAELDVLNGLSRPLPALCFEFTREFMHHSAQCIERLLSLGSYRFNYSPDIEFRFASPHWFGDRELIDTIARERGDLFCGDIWAALREDARPGVGS